MCSSSDAPRARPFLQRDGPVRAIWSTVAAPPSADAQRCAALVAADFEALPDAPTRVTRPASSSPPRIRSRPRHPRGKPDQAGTAKCSGTWRRRTSSSCGCRFRRSGINDSISRLRRFLRRGKRQRLQPTLARGYASVTGNGGHDGGPGSTACGRRTARTCRRTLPGGTIT